MTRNTQRALQVAKPLKTTTPGPAREPVQFRYQLAQWLSERRPDGWYIAKTWFAATGEKPKWEGPFAFPQDAAIAIARYLCAELSNRHMSKARFHQVKPASALYGLPASPDLMAATSTTRRTGGRS